MADLTIPQGDKGYYINFTVQDSAGVAYDLTGYTIKLKVWALGQRSKLLLDGTCAIVVAASGTCRYLVTTSDFIARGTHQAELELTQAGIIESTTVFTIEVTESPA